MNKSKLNMKALIVMTLAMGLTLIASSCKDDDKNDPVDPEVDLTRYQASIEDISDISNLNNAGDIEVSFDSGLDSDLIDEYRIILLKSDSEITSTSAKDLEAARYTLVESNSSQNSYETTLNESQLDADGETVMVETDYRLIILTKGQFNDSTVFALSEPSSTFQIVDSPFVTTLLSNSGANDGISVDDEGNIYVCNYGQYNQSTNSGTGEEVIIITPAGSASTFAVDLVGPVGGVISSSGEYYVNSGSDFITGELTKIDGENTKSTLATLRGYPSGILIGTDDNLYVANYWLPIIHEVTQEGDTSVFASDPRLKGGVGIVYGNNGEIIVGNLDSGEILSVDTEGTVSSIASVPSTIGYITFFEDHVYATGGSANKIYKVSLDGNVEVYAGTGNASSTNGSLLEASFNSPNGISVDKNERVLYVSEISGSLRVIPVK